MKLDTRHPDPTAQRGREAILIAASLRASGFAVDRAGAEALWASYSAEHGTDWKRIDNYDGAALQRVAEAGGLRRS